MQHNDDLKVLQDMVYQYRNHIEEFSKGVDYFLSDAYQKEMRQAKRAEDKLLEELGRTGDLNQRAIIQAQIDGKHKEFNKVSLKPVQFMQEQLTKIQGLENNINNKTRNIADRNAVGMIMIKLNGPGGSLSKRNYVMKLLEEGIHPHTSKSRERVIFLQLSKLSKELMTNLPQRSVYTSSAPETLMSPRVSPAPETLTSPIASSMPEKSKKESSMFAFFGGKKKGTITHSAEIEEKSNLPKPKK